MIRLSPIFDLFRHGHVEEAPGPALFVLVNVIFPHELELACDSTADAEAGPGVAAPFPGLRMHWVSAEGGGLRMNWGSTTRGGGHQP